MNLQQSKSSQGKIKVQNIHWKLKQDEYSPRVILCKCCLLLISFCVCISHVIHENGKNNSSSQTKRAHRCCRSFVVFSTGILLTIFFLQFSLVSWNYKNAIYKFAAVCSDGLVSAKKRKNEKKMPTKRENRVMSMMFVALLLCKIEKKNRRYFCYIFQCKTKKE